jgi:hypothetical protein
MAKPQVSFAKRQREQAKRERQQLKAARRAERKNDDKPSSDEEILDEVVREESLAEQ